MGGPFGSSLVGSDYVSTGVPVIRGGNLNHGRYISGDFVFVSDEKFERDLSRNSAAPGDIIYTQRGTLGQVSIVPRDLATRFVISQSQMRLRVDKKVAVPEYVYYASTSNDFLQQVSDRAISTGVPHINLGILGQLEIPLPPLPTQSAIADVLGALDDKIAANICASTRADELITAEFDRAMMDGDRSTPLLEEITIEFGEPFGGKFFSAPGCGRPLIRIRDLKSFDSQVWTTESRSRETAIDAGDVLVGMDAEFRATTWLGERGVLNQRVLRASHERYGNALVREVLRLPLNEIENEKSATTVIHLNKSDLARKSVVMPAETAMLTFERLAEPLYEARVALAKENRTLAATRDALLPQLMSGKLRVRDAEAIAADAGA